MNSIKYLLIGFLPIFLFIAYMLFDMIKNIIALYGWKNFVKYSSLVIIVLSWIIWWFVLAVKTPLN